MEIHRVSIILEIHHGLITLWFESLYTGKNVPSEVSQVVVFHNIWAVSELWSIVADYYFSNIQSRAKLTSLSFWIQSINPALFVFNL